MELSKKSATTESSKLPSKTGSRRNPYEFTGCLAHAELTERDSDGQVTQIFGIFNHNPGCEASIMSRIPAVPLHPHVYEVALEQLQNGARCSLLYVHCLKFANFHSSTWQHWINPIQKHRDASQSYLP